MPVPKDDHQTTFELIHGGKDSNRTPILDHLGRVNQKAQLTRLVEEERSKLAQERTVTLLQDHVLEYPDLYLEIFIQPDPSVSDDEARFAQMFARSGCSRAKSVLEADLVVFGGGSDVNPALYGAEPHRSVHYNEGRDQSDIDLFLLCKENGIPMLGVCRGAQFLSVMHGGKLFQDVDNHYGDHAMWDVRNKTMLPTVSSVHHQLVMNNEENGMEILAFSPKSKRRYTGPETFEESSSKDIEAFFYRDTLSLGVQGHPEYRGYQRFTKWVLDAVNECIVCNPDAEITGEVPYRRLKPSLVAERQAAYEALVTKSVKKTKQNKKELN